MSFLSSVPSRSVAIRRGGRVARTLASRPALGFSLCLGLGFGLGFVLGLGFALGFVLGLGFALGPGSGPVAGLGLGLGLGRGLLGARESDG
ncbi:hypothetical protein GCM10009863_25980 [Streptomyces axinellae]|uniref:Uncharacterized protein n=1 Tax=Streptomyces axinellae TaxID=552788 RepID=A0ABN3Q0Z2_9ACTN